MKQAFKIASVYIGLVIGAGFASGREIFEYFNLPSGHNVSGISLATVAFGILAYITMNFARRLNISDFNEFVTAVSPRLSTLIKIFMNSFMFCGFFVMMSASGTLFSDAFSLPFGSGVFLLALICFLVFIFEAKGLIAANVIMVPFMITGIICLCFVSISSAINVFFDIGSIRQHTLVSALCYVSYNTITAGAVLVPLSQNIKKRTILQASLISSGVLGVLIFLVWFTLNIYFNKAINGEMPLLDLATANGTLWKIIFSTVLFMSLCTTAISHGFGLLSKLHLHRFSDRVIVSATLCLAAMPFAYLGFSKLIATVYSVFGFAGLFWTALVVIKYIKK